MKVANSKSTDQPAHPLAGPLSYEPVSSAGDFPSLSDSQLLMPRLSDSQSERGNIVNPNGHFVLMWLNSQHTEAGAYWQADGGGGGAPPSGVDWGKQVTCVGILGGATIGAMTGGFIGYGAAAAALMAGHADLDQCFADWESAIGQAAHDYNQALSDNAGLAADCVGLSNYDFMFTDNALGDQFSGMSPNDWGNYSGFDGSGSGGGSLHLDINYSDQDRHSGIGLSHVDYVRMPDSFTGAAPHLSLGG